MIREIKSLSDVHVDLLSPKVVMLVSKYSYGVKKRHGVVLKISSKNVLQKLEEINNEIDDDVLDNLYEAIFNEFV